MSTHWAHSGSDVSIRQIGDRLVEVGAAEGAERVQIRLDVGERAARLIAAAPELLTVAQTVMAWWAEHEYDTIGDRNVFDFDPPMVEAARAAIAKTTGER